jgi:hypothetical protein
MRFTFGTVRGRRPSPLATTVMVGAVLAVVGVLVQVLTYSPGVESPTPLPSVVGSAAPTFGPTASSNADGTPADLMTPSVTQPPMYATSFDTPGVTSGWKGFSTSGTVIAATPGRIQRWRGGWLAGNSPDSRAPSSALWTSPDGQTWTPVDSIDAAMAFESVAPGGLIAVVVNPNGPFVAGAVWTSSDGLTWHNSGLSNLPGSVVSIAGTAAGIVATVDIAAGNDGDAYAIEYSSDGLHWTPDPVMAGLSSIQPGPYMQPHVQAANGQFFLMGAMASPTGGRGTGRTAFAATASPHDVVMWSDDGLSWTPSGGSYGELASSIEFGRDGLVLNTWSNAVPGGGGMAVSTDGGKTWTGDSGFGPLGPALCQGDCSTGPDGFIGSNGTYFVAVKSGGKQAWLSTDAKKWTPVSWTGPDPGLTGPVNQLTSVLPRGVLIDGVYTAAE